MSRGVEGEEVLAPSNTSQVHSTIGAASALDESTQQGDMAGPTATDNGALLNKSSSPDHIAEDAGTVALPAPGDGHVPDLISSEGDLPGLPGFPQLVTSSSPTTRDAFSDPAVRPVASTPATSPAKGIANAALLPTTAFGGQFPVAEDTASHGQDLSSSPPGMMRRSSTQPFESEKLGEKFQEVDDQTEVLSQEVEVRQAPLPKSRRGDSRKRGRSHGTDGNGSGQADASLHSDKKARQTGSSAEQLKHVGRV